MLHTNSTTAPSGEGRGELAERPRRGATPRALPLLIAFAMFSSRSAVLAQATDSSRAQPHRTPTEALSNATPISASLDSLVALAIAVNPTVMAAAARVEAARHRIAPAGALPDPMLMAGIRNLPLGREQGMRGPAPMTMRMVGVQQTFPYPGKRGLRREVAERERESALAALDAARRDVTRDVKVTYYELAFVDQALAIVDRNRDVLTGFVDVTTARYGVGTGGQHEVLEARVEMIRLAKTAVSLTEARLAAVARFNALLDRPTGTPVEHPQMPAALARAAVPASAHEIRFTSAALGARAADSPLPSLADLEDAAIRENPEIREHEAMIAAQMARLALARKRALPDLDLSLEYGQRGSGLPDMVSTFVSLPIPVFRGRKQDQLVAEASAQLDALRAEHRAKVNELRADVARRVSEIERARAQLALFVKALLPESRASLRSATASYQVGRVDLLTVLDDQATVFRYETEYFRVLSDFAKAVADLERVVGREIVQ